jgi:hypothetical protein
MKKTNQNNNVTALDEMLARIEQEDKLSGLCCEPEQWTGGVDQTDASGELHTLVRMVRMVRYLYTLREHMEREKDVSFPKLRKQGYVGLCLAAEKEHVRLTEIVDTLIDLVLFLPSIPLEEFETRMMAVVQSFHSLLQEHLDHEERLSHPTRPVAVKHPGTWEAIKALCSQIGYSELPV